MRLITCFIRCRLFLLCLLVPFFADGQGETPKKWGVETHSIRSRFGLFQALEIRKDLGPIVVGLYGVQDVSRTFRFQGPRGVGIRASKTFAIAPQWLAMGFAYFQHIENKWEQSNIQTLALGSGFLYAWEQWRAGFSFFSGLGKYGFSTGQSSELVHIWDSGVIFSLGYSFGVPDVLKRQKK